jgi:hypothetical protein
MITSYLTLDMYIVYHTEAVNISGLIPFAFVVCFGILPDWLNVDTLKETVYCIYACVWGWEMDFPPRCQFGDNLVGIMQYSRASVSTDSVSANTAARKKIGKLKK